MEISFSTVPSPPAGNAVEQIKCDPLERLAIELFVGMLKSGSLGWLDFKACGSVSKKWREVVSGQMARNAAAGFKEQFLSQLTRLSAAMMPLLKRKNAGLLDSPTSIKERQDLHLKFDETKAASWPTETLSGFQQQTQMAATLFDLFSRSVRLTLSLLQSVDRPIKAIQGLPPLPESSLTDLDPDYEGKMVTALSQFADNGEIAVAIGLVQAYERFESTLLRPARDEHNKAITPHQFLTQLIRKRGVEGTLELICQMRIAHQRNEWLCHLMETLVEMHRREVRPAFAEVNDWITRLAAIIGQIQATEPAVPTMAALFISSALILGAHSHEDPSSPDIPGFIKAIIRFYEQHDSVDKVHEHVIGKIFANVDFFSSDENSQQTRSHLLVFLNLLPNTLRVATAHGLSAILENAITNFIQEGTFATGNWHMLVQLERLTEPDSTFERLLTRLFKGVIKHKPAYLTPLLANQELKELPHIIVNLLQIKPDFIYAIMQGHLDESSDEEMSHDEFDRTSGFSRLQAITSGYDSWSDDEMASDATEHERSWSNSYHLLKIVAELLRQHNQSETIQKMIACIPQGWSSATKIKSILEEALRNPTNI